MGRRRAAANRGGCWGVLPGGCISAWCQRWTLIWILAVQRDALLPVVVVCWCYLCQADASMNICVQCTVAFCLRQPCQEPPRLPRQLPSSLHLQNYRKPASWWLPFLSRPTIVALDKLTSWKVWPHLRLFLPPVIEDCTWIAGLCNRSKSCTGDDFTLKT